MLERVAVRTYPVTCNSWGFLFKNFSDSWNPCHMAWQVGHRFCCVTCLFARFCVRDCGRIFLCIIENSYLVVIMLPPTLFRFISVSYDKISLLHFF